MSAQKPDGVVLMTWDSDSYKHQELTQAIIQVFYDVYNELGHGFLDSVYEAAMAVALSQKGLRAIRQHPLPVWFRDHGVGNFYADIIVEDAVIIELKAARNIESAHEAQLLNYFKSIPDRSWPVVKFWPRAKNTANGV